MPRQFAPIPRDVDLDRIAAGEELDAWIATHLFEELQPWTERPTLEVLERQLEGMRILSPRHAWSLLCDRQSEPLRARWVPECFSRDLRLAMEANQKACAQGLGWALVEPIPTGGYVAWHHAAPEFTAAEWYACADTVPLAICRALAKAVRRRQEAP